MNRLEIRNKHKEVVQYLCTVLDTDDNGLPIYPTIKDTAKKFGYHETHVFRIKKRLMGLDDKNNKKEARRLSNEQTVQ